MHLLRRADGSVLLFNDVGSGWNVNGRAPSDAYLLARRNDRTPYDDAIVRHAGQEGVDPGLVRSVVLVESNFNPRAVSRKGARGLMQLMPATAARYGVRDSFDPLQNIRGGVRHLADLLTLYRGDVVRALAAYNAGAGAVDRYAGVPPYPETQEYVRRAMLVYRGSAAVPVLSGGFKGMTPAPAPAPRRPPSPPAAPVKLRVDDGTLVLSNLPAAASSSRGAPLLGRVAPSR